METIIRQGGFTVYFVLLMLIVIGFSPNNDYRIPTSNHAIVTTDLHGAEYVEPNLEPATNSRSVMMRKTMNFENNKWMDSKRSGYYPDVNRWYPHRSIEGGSDTIAYGHKLTGKEVATGNIIIAGKAVRYNNGLSDTQAKILFKQDWHRAEDARYRLVGNDHPAEVLHVITSMVYQMGEAGVAGFNDMLTSLSQKDYQGAAYEMLDSKWARIDSPSRAMELSDIVASYSG